MALATLSACITDLRTIKVDLGVALDNLNVNVQRSNYEGRRKAIDGKLVELNDKLTQIFELVGFRNNGADDQTMIGYFNTVDRSRARIVAEMSQVTINNYNASDGMHSLQAAKNQFQIIDTAILRLFGAVGLPSNH